MNSISRIGIAVIIAFVAAFALAVCVRAEEPASPARPVPLTRPEMKEALEALKKIKPRIPLPELSSASAGEDTRGGCASSTCPPARGAAASALAARPIPKCR